jgi:hypothetical protein
MSIESEIKSLHSKLDTIMGAIHKVGLKLDVLLPEEEAASINVIGNDGGPISYSQMVIALISDSTAKGSHPDFLPDFHHLQFIDGFIQTVVNEVGSFVNWELTQEILESTGWTIE